MNRRTFLGTMFASLLATIPSRKPKDSPKRPANESQVQGGQKDREGRTEAFTSLSDGARTCMWHGPERGPTFIYCRPGDVDTVRAIVAAGEGKG
jgi:hypothetical protein